MGLDKRTLLVLGAGASAPYGLPLGAQLTEEVAYMITRLQRNPNKINVQRDYQGERFSHEKDNLASTIRLSRSPTIDTFISHLKKDKRLVTSAVANTIWEKEDRFLRDIDNELPSNQQPASLYQQDDWISWLFHTRLYKSPEDFHRNNLAVISYNYDRIPIALLINMMANSFQHSIADCKSIIEKDIPDIGQRFLFPHGTLPGELHVREATTNRGALTTTNYENNYTNDAEKCLFTMFDTARIASFQSEIDKRMEWAEQIFFLGIGYHEEILSCYKPQQIATINFLESKHKSIYGTAYKLDADLRQSIINRFKPSSYGSKSGVTDFPRITLGDDNERCIPLLARYLESS